MSGEPPILLVAGLGNPGSGYAWTWHNMGFLVLDFWAKGKGLTFHPGRGDFYYLTHKLPHGDVTFIKPTSFMNLSGFPVKGVMHHRTLTTENVLIVCDDAALPLGTIRIRRSGSGGGQKGLESVIAELESEEVPRFRMGIHTSGWRGKLGHYVLTRIPRKFHPDIEKMLAVSSDALDCILVEGLAPAMNRFNRNFLTAESDPGPHDKAAGS